MLCSFHILLQKRLSFAFPRKGSIMNANGRRWKVKPKKLHQRGLIYSACSKEVVEQVKAENGPTETRVTAYVVVLKVIRAEKFLQALL